MGPQIPHLLPEHQQLARCLFPSRQAVGIFFSGYTELLPHHHPQPSEKTFVKCYLRTASKTASSHLVTLL